MLPKLKRGDQDSLKIPNLPNDIVFDILCRLPVTSLCRFKCVSKPWHSLISSDPLFIKSHLNLHNNQQRLILVSDFWDFYSVVVNDDSQAIHLKFSSKVSSQLSLILGSCNGLLLVKDCFSYFFVNPSTREYKELPRSIFSIKTKFGIGSVGFVVDGFGYDSSNDDYKVVRISFHHSSDNVASVYSLRKNLWRRIEDSPYDHSDGEWSSGVLVSGALHWLPSKCKHLSTCNVIASFDLRDERFRDVSKPCGPFVPKWVILGVLRGCLCVLAFRNGSYRCHDVWVMKEYGVADSWSKFTINMDIPGDVYRMVYLTGTDEFLLETHENKLVLLNPRQGKSKELVVRGSPVLFDLTTYVESLVSPNCCNMTKRQCQA